MNASELFQLTMGAVTAMQMLSLAVHLNLMLAQTRPMR